MHKSNKATAADVAKAAGVSKWTVTRAFTPGASIAEASRERVLQEAQRLGYRPNLLARSLATKKTNQVAVLVDDFANPYKLVMLEALTQALQERQMAVMLLNINRHFDHVSAMLDADQRQVDAVVLVGTDFHEAALRPAALPPSSAPLYVLARESSMPNITSVSCDPQASMAAINQHLWQRGYRRPGFMSGPQSLSTGLGRKQQFMAFWQEKTGTRPPELPVGNYDRSAAAAVFRAYWAGRAAGQDIDVLMCENDTLAMGVVDAARYEMGLRLPEQLAIVGYDGDPLTASPAYDITTYRQPMEHMVHTLVDMISGSQPLRSVNLAGELLLRSSS